MLGISQLKVMKAIGLFAIQIIIYTHTVNCQELNSVNQVDGPTFEGQYYFILSSKSDCAKISDEEIEKGDAKLIICYPKDEHYAFYSNQNQFEEKYRITYQLYNCTDENEKCIKKYNKQVLQYLNRKFGRDWKRKVRQDVYGLK